jgi:hypothetical protein
MCKSLCSVRLETYRGALVMDRRILDCSRCMICVWDGFAQPQSCIPYVHTGLSTHLYRRSLFSRKSFIDIYVRNLQSTDKEMIPATDEIGAHAQDHVTIDRDATTHPKSILTEHSLQSLCVAAEQSVASSFSPPFSQKSPVEM